MRLGLSKILGKLVLKYVPTNTKGTLYKEKKKKSAKDLSNDAYTIFFVFLHDFHYSYK